MKKFIWLIAVLFLSAQHAFGGDMESFDLKNNIKVIFNKTSGVEVVSVRILTPVSVICENQDNAGISYLTAKMMTKSTKNRNSEQLARDIENIGASLIGDAEYDIAGISTNFLSEYFDSAMEILSDAVKNPSFNEDEILFEKQNIIAGLNSRKDSIGRTANDNFISYFYNGNAYSLPVLGKEETVSKLSAEDLRNWHAYSFNASNIIISVAGNIDKKDVKNSLEKYFGDIESGKKFEKPVFILKDLDGKKYDIKGKFNQAYILTSYAAPELSDKDFVNLKVINILLGGRMTSRLFVELREKLGLAYEVGAIYPSRRNESYFAIYIGLDKKNIDLTLNRIDEIMKDFCANKVDPQELKDTISYFKGIYIMDRLTVSKQSYYYGWREVLGQGYKYDDIYLEEIEKVTPEDIYETANRIFNKKTLTVIINPDEK